MKIVYFNYAAFALLALILVTAVIRKVGTTRANRSFLMAVGEVLIATVFLIWAVALDNAGTGNVIGKYISHGGYLYFHTLTALFYLTYLISLTDSWHVIRQKTGRKLFLIVPVLSFTIVFIAQFFLPVKTYFVNDADVYTRGPLFLFNYVVGGIYLIYGLFYIISYRALFTPRWILTLFAPYPFIAVAMVIEFFSPQQNIEMFFNALGLLFVFINIQKPEELQDTTTGLGNVLAFEVTCDRALYNRKPIRVIIADLSNYDSVKDMLDYDGNRKIRRGIAEFLRGINKTYGLKGQIFYGRQGRFFIVCENTDRNTVDRAAENIYSVLNNPEAFSEMRISPQTSVCVVSAPDDISDFETFMRFCNKDMFVEGGLSYADELFKDNRYKVLMNIDKIVADAIEFGRLEVYYQPIYSFAQGRFVSAEALLRLKDPEFGFVSPDIFIPQAEKSGEISRIWDFVIDSVCRFVASEAFAKLGLEYIEVNLSAVQCVQEHLAENIIRTVQSYNIDCSRISIEITETALVYGEETVAANLQKLSDAGMLICLDDYGTGYSNTRRIMDLPLDIVKLDKSFLDGYENEKVLRLISNTIKMLKEEGVHVVAEGVETDAVLQMLKDCSCDMIQGYYFAKPMPREKFEEWVKG